MFWNCWKCKGDGYLEKDDNLNECPACKGTGDYCSEGQFIEFITKPPTPTRFMELGKAFHNILEDTNKASGRAFDKYGRIDVLIAANGIEFPMSVIETCCRVINLSFPFEIKTTKIYEFPYDTIELVGKVDQLVGLEIVENKTVWSWFDYNKYSKSIQWKLYMELFEAERVNYNVFIMKDNGIIWLLDIQQFHFDSYLGLEQDNRIMLGEFLSFIKHNNLEKYFEGKNENFENIYKQYPGD
jgi:hypothetical protein